MTAATRYGHVHAKASKLDKVYQGFLVRDDKSEGFLEYFDAASARWLTLPQEWTAKIVWQTPEQSDAENQAIIAREAERQRAAGPGY